MLWASSNGIVNGIEGGKFDPDGIVNREQLATILYRYSEWKKLSTDKRADFSESVNKKSGMGKPIPSLRIMVKKLEYRSCFTNCLTR